LTSTLYMWYSLWRVPRRLKEFHMYRRSISLCFIYVYPSLTPPLPNSMSHNNRHLSLPTSVCQSISDLFRWGTTFPPWWSICLCLCLSCLFVSVSVLSVCVLPLRVSWSWWLFFWLRRYHHNEGYIIQQKEDLSCREDLKIIRGQRNSINIPGEGDKNKSPLFGPVSVQIDNKLFLPIKKAKNP
jgi:hypothetical protein